MIFFLGYICIESCSFIFNYYNKTFRYFLKVNMRLHLFGKKCFGTRKELNSIERYLNRYISTKLSKSVAIILITYYLKQNQT